MSGVQALNANAETMGRQAALFMNINAAKGLEDVMKTNLGPKGTIKMLVGGAGGEAPCILSLRVTMYGAEQRHPAAWSCHELCVACLLLFHLSCWFCRYQANQGRQRAAARNANHKSHGLDDR